LAHAVHDSSLTVRTFLLLWISATLAWTATVEIAPSWCGPWLISRSDGQRQIGLECQDAAPSDQEVALQRAGAGPRLPLTVSHRELRRPGRPASTVFDMRISERDCPPGDYRLSMGARAFDISFAPGIQDGRAARVAVMGRWNYPGRKDLERLGEALGGPVQLVVGVGSGLGEPLGTGGWEATIPLLLLAGAADRADVEGPSRLAGLVGDGLSQWPLGTRWGALGLPCADRDHAGHAIAADLSPWQVFIEPQASWNPSLRARDEAQAAEAQPLIALCQRMQLPLVLAGAGGAGFISEPLAVADGRLRVSPGGTRYLGACPAGEGLSSLPAEIALAVDQAALIGLVADAQSLAAVVLPLNGDAALHLVYLRGDDPAARLGAGWGAGDGEALKKQWLAGGENAAAALDELGWLSGSLLAAMHVGDEELSRLVAGAASDPHAMRLLRRLSGVSAIADGLMQHRTDTLPAVLTRDLVLRQLGRGPDIDQELIAPAASSGDLLLLRALLRDFERHPSADLARLLTRRIALQANGVLPLESDALIEHRLIVAVFDSTTTSPTALRPLAVALRSRLEAPLRGPVERFLARHGETRAP
jgi:hypothetical protein